MRTYHLYYLRDAMLVGFDNIQAASNIEAERIARQRGQGDITEIWDAVSRVRVVPSPPGKPGQAG